MAEDILSDMGFFGEQIVGDWYRDNGFSLIPRSYAQTCFRNDDVISDGEDIRWFTDIVAENGNEEGGWELVQVKTHCTRSVNKFCHFKASKKSLSNYRGFSKALACLPNPSGFSHTPDFVAYFMVIVDFGGIWQIKMPDVPNVLLKTKFEDVWAIPKDCLENLRGLSASEKDELAELCRLGSQGARNRNGMRTLRQRELDFFGVSQSDRRR